VGGPGGRGEPGVGGGVRAVQPASFAGGQRRALRAAFAEFTERLADNYPFFHPRYAGQMLKPRTRPAVAGYLAAMLINPNNHALDGGPATARMEREVTAQLADMFGSAPTWATSPPAAPSPTWRPLFVALDASQAARSGCGV